MNTETNAEQSENLPNDHMRVMNFVDGRCSFIGEQDMSEEAGVCRLIVNQGPYSPEENTTLNSDIDAAYDAYLLSFPVVPQWKFLNWFDRFL